MVTIISNSNNDSINRTMTLRLMIGLLRMLLTDLCCKCAEEAPPACTSPAVFVFVEGPSIQEWFGNLRVRI